MSITPPCANWSTGTSTRAPTASRRSAPPANRRRSSHDEHEKVIAAVVEQAARPDQGHARHRLEQHARGDPPDEVRQEGRGRRRAAWSARTTTSRRRKATTATSPPSPTPCDLPIVLYNIPGRTGVEHHARDDRPTGGRCPSIVAVKEATGSLDQASHIASLCDLTILSGDDSLTLPLMSIGGRGVVSVVGNIVPRDLKALVSAFDAGKIGRGARLAPQAVHAVPRPARRWRRTRSR